MKEKTIGYYEDGNVEYEHYFQNGDLHNIEGPAYVCYHKNGNVLYEHYYLKGKIYSKEEYYKMINPSCEGKIVEIDGVRYQLTEV